MEAFETAADAVVAGDLRILESLLEEHPELSTARSDRSHRATLLHYLGANGVEEERQRSPENAVEVGELLLRCGADVNATADIYGGCRTLQLVASSVHPERAGVQVGLLQMLLEHGATAGAGHESAILPALRNGRKGAAEFLAAQGLPLDFEAAAGVGRLDVVKNLYPSAAQEDIEAGFLWACEYGRDAVVEFLLNKGVAMEAKGKTGSTGLHWAVIGGQTETVRLLLRRGASLAEINAYGATALGQAVWSAANCGGEVNYDPMIEMLRRSSSIQS